MKKVLILFFALALVLSIIPINAMAESSVLSKIDQEIFSLGKDAQIDVFVRLDGDCVVRSVTFDGTYPTVSSEIMRANNSLTKIALNAVISEQSMLKNQVKSILGYTPKTWIQYASNGFVAKARFSQIKKLASLSQVKHVFYSRPRELHRYRSRKFIGADRVHSEIKDPRGRTVDGTGVLCAVTDSGLDYTHQDFGSQRSPVGKKVVISRDLARNDDDCQEEEYGMHGTACAGIVAGDGPGNEKGIAPKALLAGYKIAGSDGGLENDAILKSWDYLIKDKIQVSNNSYGAPYGSSKGGEAELEDNAVLAGCVIVASQGNNGSPGEYFLYPSGNTSAPDNVIAVGALDERDMSKIHIMDAPEDNMVGIKYVGEWGNTGKTFKDYDAPLEVVDCAWGRPQDFEGLDLKGKVALIQRGPEAALKEKFGDPLSFKLKSLNAAKAGARFILLYNYESTLPAAMYSDSQNGPLDPNLIPSFHIYKNDAFAIRKQLHLNNEWELGAVDTKQNKVVVAVTLPKNKGNMSSYSSVGPTRDLMLKPDVSAPADDIRTSSSKEVQKQIKGEYIDWFNGTSAAGPFVAGCSALIVQARPEWKPLEVKRALMNTATLLTRFVDNRYIQLTAQGQGRVNVYDAVTADLLMQPPSALIVAKTKAVRVADMPNELKDSKLKDSIPLEIKNSTIPLKFYNYGTKSKEIELSYEINSRYPDLISVTFTNSTVIVDKAKKNDKPSSAFVGVNISFPSEIKGDLNDVIIFAYDKQTKRKIHMGVSIFTLDPAASMQTNTVELSDVSFEPNGDGEKDTIKVDFTVTSGSLQWTGRWWEYDNYLRDVKFYIIDSNSQRWALMYEGSSLELGFHSFEWNGKDSAGNYILPEGEWYLQIVPTCYAPNSQRQLVPMELIWYDLFKKPLVVAKSTVPPLPTLSAFSIPLEPGVGQEFEVGIYIKHALNLKSLQFKLDFSGLDGVVKYLGSELKDFLSQNEPNTLPNFDYDDEKNTLFVDIQRPLDGVSGEGYIMTIRMLALESNFVDIDFKNIQVTVIDTNDLTGKEKNAKAFYKKAEIVIQKQAYDKLDFNLDGQVDGKDLVMISSKLGTKKGDSAYYWRCDLNYDSLIDFTDFAEFAKNYN